MARKRRANSRTDQNAITALRWGCAGRRLGNTSGARRRQNCYALLMSRMGSVPPRSLNWQISTEILLVALRPTAQKYIPRNPPCQTERGVRTEIRRYRGHGVRREVFRGDRRRRAIDGRKTLRHRGGRSGNRRTTPSPRGRHDAARRRHRPPGWGVGRGGIPDF